MFYFTNQTEFWEYCNLTVTIYIVSVRIYDSFMNYDFFNLFKKNTQTKTLVPNPITVILVYIMVNLVLVKTKCWVYTILSWFVFISYKTHTVYSVLVLLLFIPNVYPVPKFLKEFSVPANTCIYNQCL